MAATIAIAIGQDKSRRKETHRLGSEESIAKANTWRTFATACVNKDGSGYVQVKRDGVTIHTFSFDKESNES